MNYDAMVAFHMDHDAALTMATIRVPMEDASRFGVVGVQDDYTVRSFVEKPADPPSNLANMGVYLFNTKVLNRALWEDHHSHDSSHDFGKDILPRLIKQGERVLAYPYSGYWVDVGTIDSYWQAHMDLLHDKPSINLNDRSWIIHTRTEERPPVRISRDAVVADSMISDGCVISAGARIERSVLSPGVVVHPGAIVRESIVLTDATIQSGAVIERSIIDKIVQIGENSRVGSIETSGRLNSITMIGKKSIVPQNIVIEAGAMIGTDVAESDYTSDLVRGDDYIETMRQAYEV
jgi:glucose-1-phosphate adenylyltransferase